MFVDDVGANPGAPMVITAGRGGRLREVACFDSVSPEHACYLAAAAAVRSGGQKKQGLGNRRRNLTSEPPAFKPLSL